MPVLVTQAVPYGQRAAKAPREPAPLGPRASVREGVLPVALSHLEAPQMNACDEAPRKRHTEDKDGTSGSGGMDSGLVGSEVCSMSVPTCVLSRHTPKSFVGIMFAEL